MLDENLSEVLTIREVAYMWGRHEKTVRRAINSRRKGLEARQPMRDSMGVWLISYRSCVRRWGLPEKPLKVSG